MKRQMRPGLERLEARGVPAGHTLATATPLAFRTQGVAESAGFLADGGQVDLYRVRLEAGDLVRAAISASPGGGALQSVLRVFAADGRPVALNEQLGGDPSLSFQASGGGVYYVGVSSAGNGAYDPGVEGGGATGASKGLYSLQMRRESVRELKADLAGASFRVRTEEAAWGEAVGLAFRVENRGGAGGGAFEVQVLLSPDNLFGEGSVVLRSFVQAGLAAGGAFTSPAGLEVALPATAPAGFAASGRVYVGLRIVPADPGRDSGVFDKSGVHRGADWGEVTVVTPATPSGNNHSLAGADRLGDVNVRIDGVLIRPGRSHWYRMNLSEGSSLTATLIGRGAAPAGLRLRLVSADGDGLSEYVAVNGKARLDQHLEPGRYYLVVTGQIGEEYRLTTTLAEGSSPIAVVLDQETANYSVAADVNGDGRVDLICTQIVPSRVSVLLGGGDGTFGSRKDYLLSGGEGAWQVRVADFNQDGKSDLVTGNVGAGSLTVLIGRGDGTTPSKVLETSSR